MLRILSLLSLSLLLLSCISTAPQTTDSSPTSYNPDNFHVGEDQPRRNPEDGATARECEPVSAEKIRSELLAGVNQLRRQGCDCMGTMMPKAGALKWDEDKAYTAELHANKTAKGDIPLELVGTWTNSVNGENSGQSLILQNEGANDVARLIISLQLRTDQCQQLMNKDFRKIGASKQGCYWSVVLE